eukprot:TRINITY_DN3111_c0_g1_i1.p1 TRINITY_DN3111_c0_g1~~TRINITY_DN3111_c0_g1_i1.p1  ORF type:complete len:113 (+),score=2.14 TRINITY_DN3111_c0_g1_i1:70-408(+)
MVSVCVVCVVLVWCCLQGWSDTGQLGCGAAYHACAVRWFVEVCLREGRDVDQELVVTAMHADTRVAGLWAITHPILPGPFNQGRGVKIKVEPTVTAVPLPYTRLELPYAILL